MKNINQRVGVFVDVSNLYHSAKNLYNSRVNFGAVLKDAVDGRALIRAITYVVSAAHAVPQALPTDEGQALLGSGQAISPEEGFFEALRLAGYEVKAKDLQVFAGGMKKGDWDVGITIDAVTLAQKLDVVVLVTGDGDYVPLVEYLRTNTGCRVEVMAFSKSTSARLIEAADEFTDLDKAPEKYLIRQRVVRRSTSGIALPPKSF